MRKEVFEPLEMKHSFVFDAGKDTLPFISKGYAYSRWEEIENNYLDGITGDKGIYSTIEDLYKWDRALFEGRLIKNETLKEAHLPAHTNISNNRNYGYGWRTRELIPGYIIPYHGGWWHGYKSLLIHDPLNETTIIILSNRLNNSFLKNYDHLLHILNPEKYGMNNKIDFIVNNSSQTKTNNSATTKSGISYNAQSQITKNEETEEYKQAEKQNTAEAFESFLENYPESYLAEKAKNKIKVLREVESQLAEIEADITAFEQAMRTGTISALLNYRKNFPNGLHYAEATRELNRLEQEYLKEIEEFKKNDKQ